MSWRYIAPQRCDFDSEEDYQDALNVFEEMRDIYAEEHLERRRG